MEALRYKLRMLGVPIDGPCSVMCDNESVVKNSSIPETMLRRKHNSIAYHRVQESAAAGIVCIGYVHSSTNLADMLTKPLPRVKIHALCEQILY
jgi:fatty acid/phospholipid biosynthesis enzyme